MTYYNNRAKFT